MKLPESASGMFALMAGFFYCIDSIALAIFIVANYGSITSGDLSILPAIIVYYSLPIVLGVIAVAFGAFFLGVVGSQGL
jgi:hypothetical protein